MGLSDDETIQTPTSGGGDLRHQSLAEGDVLGGYRIERLLGRGGMGEVYLAEHTQLKRRYALKLLPAELSRDASFRSRFKGEAQTLAQLQHGNIVDIVYAGEDADRHFLVMEYVAGGSLEDYLTSRGGKLPDGEVKDLLRQLLTGLDYAHKHKVVHRDLKPANLLHAPDGTLKITDFGLARVVGEDYVQSMVQKSIQLSMSGLADGRTIFGESLQGETLVTGLPSSGRAAAFVGTIDFMSPEVRAGRQADIRSDLFAVGIIAYQLLTGRKPLGMAAPASARVKGLSRKWDVFIARCLEEDPMDRFQDPAEALEALARLPARKPYTGPAGAAAPAGSTSGPWKPVAVALALLAAAAAGYFASQPSSADVDVPLAESPPQATRAESAPPQPPAPDPGTQVPKVQQTFPNSIVTQADALAAVPASPASGQAWTVPDYGIEMAWIAPGSFMMGSPSNESGRGKDETQHRVTLTHGYWLGRYEVTQGQWAAVMGSNTSLFKLVGANAPVETVSWTEAMDFCRKLTERERAAGRLPAGYAYTLPSEAQWEYACRAGMTGAYGGTGNLDSMGWYDQNSGITTHPVGQKAANAWGLYDMHGNVWEWCLDWKSDYPSSAVTDPSGPSSGTFRVFRGGSWYDATQGCTAANRYEGDPDGRDDSLGFRLALSIM